MEEVEKTFIDDTSDSEEEVAENFFEGKYWGSGDTYWNGEYTIHIERLPSGKFLILLAMNNGD